MSNQFQLSADESRAAAEEILGGQLVCPLCGEYEVVRDQETRCWDSVGAHAPAEFPSVFLKWFRGAQFQLLKQEGRLTLVGWLDLQRAAN